MEELQLGILQAIISTFMISAVIGCMIGFCLRYSIWAYREKLKITSGASAVVALLYVAFGIIITDRLSSELALVAFAGAVVGFGINAILVRLIQRLAKWVATKQGQKRV